ncbi:hypothetical protein STW0522CIT27_29550 [Citrobacter portucalensis]|nr:hypothetical protein STW0522CIT27_29550 [Citrobacter portucalensis]
MKNKIALTLISFLANFIMAGFASQFGMPRIQVRSATLSNLSG